MNMGLRIPTLLTPAVLMLAACTPSMNDAPAPPPVGMAGECNAAAADALVGQPATADLGAQALARTGARTLRWLQPGMAVTMDYRQDRLNIALDDKNVVTRITCG